MVYIGCAGWTIPRQFSCEFPAIGSHLERYASVLPCSEINSSFHRAHRTTTWRRWAMAVPAGFRFAVKATKTLTHESRLLCTDEDLTRFLEQAFLLGEKLGPILLQTPPKLMYESNVAHTFFSYLRMLYPGQVVIEPRHPSWFTDDAERLLIDFDIARVAADPAPVPGGEHPGGSNRLSYYRWHGTPRTYYSPYSSEAISALAASLRNKNHGDDVWCIFDNTASGAAAGNALQLLHSLAE